MWREADYLEEWISTRATDYLDVSPTGWVTVYLETPSGTELDTEPAVRFYTDLEAEAGPCTNACACASKMYNIDFM